MKVLMTGMTPRHVGRGVTLGYGIIGDYVRQALEFSGHVVEMRAVVPGEDLRLGEYDACVVGLSPAKGNPSRYLYGALWTIMRAGDCGGRLTFYVDDWQYDKVVREARNQVNDLGSMFNAHKRTCRASMDEALGVREWLEAGLKALAENEWSVTLYPSWSWGDTSIAAEHLPAREIIRFDPTAWALPETTATAPATVADSERERRWVMSSLADKGSWLQRQAITWPTTVYGPGGVGTIPEVEVRADYAHAWGVLSPEYGHAGSGWWRCRVVNTVEARAILLGGRTELAAMGDEWVRRGPQIEEMSVAELRELADAQWLSVRRWMTPAAQAAAELEGAVERSKL